jgi:RHS repeat-associated protein
VFTQTTSYNALNLPITLNNPDNTLLYYGYDKGGLLNFVQRNNTEVHISNIEYNEKQQRLNIYYGNNTKTKYEYNPLNFRLTRILTTRNSGQDTLQDLNYTYDAVGNIIQQTDNAQQTNYFDNQVVAPTGTYTYDALYRLIAATGRELSNLSMPTADDFPDNIPCPNPAANAMQNYTQQYEYDQLGNILKLQSTGAWTRNYIYDTATNKLLRHSGTTDEYSYDAHGNMLSMPHLSAMIWDYQDQLHSATNGTFTSYYNYDAEGNRTRKIVDKGNIIETRYYINGYEVFRKENSGTLDTERTTLNISDDEKVFVRVEKKTGENEVVRYQYDNHLASACLELDETGQIISYEEYHPFGTTSYRSGHSEVEVSLKRYKYCGKERDEETGLYYYGMRYYAAWLCRFVSVDPLQFKYPYYTPYQYAGNKPISFIDLDGGEEKKVEEPPPNNNEPAGLSNGVGSQEKPLMLNEIEVSPNGNSISSTNWNSKQISDNLFLIRVGSNIYTSNVDLWSGVPEGLEGYNGYTYNIKDLQMRYKIMQGGSHVLRESIRSFENRGWAEPLTGENYWNTYGATLGKLRVFAQVFEAVSMGTSAVGGVSASRSLASRVNVSKGSNSTLNAVKTNVTEKGIQLTKSQSKSISSLKSQIVKHEAKLEEYIKDPMKFDNKGFLKNAPNDAVRQQIIQSRINHLQKEIQTFKNNIQKIRGQ